MLKRVKITRKEKSFSTKPQKNAKSTFWEIFRNYFKVTWEGFQYIVCPGEFTLEDFDKYFRDFRLKGRLDQGAEEKFIHEALKTEHERRYRLLLEVLVAERVQR